MVTSNITTNLRKGFYKLLGKINKDLKKEHFQTDIGLKIGKLKKIHIRITTQLNQNNLNQEKQVK